jgi:hypothetical protein
LVREDLRDIRAELTGNPTAVATKGEILPGDDRTIVLEGSEGVTIGEYPRDAGAELRGYSIAVTTASSFSPGDDGSIGL